jgi:hypothetical protein
MYDSIGQFVTFAKCTVLLLLVTTSSLNSPAIAADADIRRLPYPFGQMVTVSSDVDYEAPWHGRAIHKFLNEDLGIPISDSVWVSGSTGAPDVSAFFSSFSGLNKRPSLVVAFPVFELLIREWHRGNIDHLHSWTDDAAPQYKVMLATPAKLLNSRVEIAELPKAPWISAFQPERGYQQFRLFFDTRPPVDLSIELRYSDGTSLVYNKAEVLQASSNSATLILNEEWPLGPPTAIKNPLPTIDSLILRAPSCERGCEVSLIGLERDNFSRYSVLQQMPFLEYMNIRPSVSTAHGGLTYYPDFEGPGEHYLRDDMLSDGPGSDSVRREMEGLAGKQDSIGYHADLLRKLGVRSVTSIWNPPFRETVSFAESIPAPIQNYEGFYALIKTHGFFGPLSGDLSEVSKILSATDAAASDFPAESYLCKDNVYCRQADQGSTVGGLIALSLGLIKKGRFVENNWYTHLGTSRLDTSFVATADAPFAPVTMAAFASLASYYYDSTGKRPLSQRVWVPPAGVWANYNIVRAHIGEHTVVDPVTSAIHISSYFDPVLGTNLPDKLAGTRDLNGITVFVKNSDVATVTVDDKPITQFVRNQPDDSGRESISIVDNNTPTIILGRIAPENSATVTSEGGVYEWISQPPAAHVGPPSFVRLTANSNTASLKLAMKSLSVWNATHFGFSYRITRSDGRAPHGRASIVFERNDGIHVTFAQSAPDNPPISDSYAFFERHEDTQDWRAVTIPQYELRWPQNWSKPVLPLILGPIRSVQVQLLDAAEGDTLEIGDLKMFRSSADGSAPDGTRVVAGRVLDSTGKTIEGIGISADFDGDRRHTVTDQFGYYAFGGVKQGAIAAISASHLGRECAPTRGPLMEVQANEVEVDINLGDCH